ncbi:MAG: magnesium transporter CorA family protein [Nanoarchaeota archaeon]|nr:magnesium transporter CorA family protein [Nanoarchaeota archaeon]
MIEYYGKKGKDQIEKIEGFKEGCWVSVVNPDEKEIKELVEKFSLNKESVLDGLDIHENSRFEVDGSKTYIYLTVPTNKIAHENDSSFLIIYGKKQLITISKTNLEIFDRILNEKSKFIDFTISKNLVRLLFLVSRLFEDSVRKIRKEIRKNRRELSKLNSKDIEKLISYEDTLNDYNSSFKATINTYTKILRDKSTKFLKRDEERIEDLIIDLNETLGLCEQTLKTISNMRTYYSTKLSNDLNKTVTVLTMVTIFISIPTLIASIYGMNVILPFQNSPHIFGFLMVLILLIIGVFFFVLKKVNLIK